MREVGCSIVAIGAAIAVASCGGGDARVAPANSYKVGGTVTGLSGAGLVLQNNGGDFLQIAADGHFSFRTAMARGSAYVVSVQ